MPGGHPAKINTVLLDNNSGDGQLSYEEFVDLILRHMQELREQLMLAFAVFDKDGKGNVLRSLNQAGMRFISMPKLDFEKSKHKISIAKLNLR